MTEETQLKEQKRLRNVTKEALLKDGLLDGLTPEEEREAIEKGYQVMTKVLDSVRKVLITGETRNLVLTEKGGKIIEVIEDVEQMICPA